MAQMVGEQRWPLLMEGDVCILGCRAMVAAPSFDVDVAMESLTMIG